MNVQYWPRCISVVRVDQPAVFACGLFRLPCDGSVQLLVFGQCLTEQAVFERLHELEVFVTDWELVTGVRLTLEQVAPYFAEGDGLPTEWHELTAAQIRAFDRGKFELFAERGMFVGPPTQHERFLRGWMRRESPVQSLIEPTEQAILRELLEQYGQLLSVAQATALAGEWLIDRQDWTIEVCPVNDRQGQLLGFTVFGLLGLRESAVQMWDLSQPLSELAARRSAMLMRIELELIACIPFHPARKQGIRGYFEALYADSLVSSPPALLMPSDVLAMRHWAVFLVRTGQRVIEATVCLAQERQWLDCEFEMLMEV